jgi:hypothetical protein
MMRMARAYRAGESLEDFCRVCKTDRMHTVIAADAEGVPIRVVCGYCHSEHNYRGGPRVAVEERQPAARTARPESSVRRGRPDREPFPTVSDRERALAPMLLRASNMPNDDIDIEMLLRRVIREETGLTPVTPADKWRGGSLVLRPGTPGLQEKSWPIETFFHKIVMLRNRLRTLEQQVNATDMPEDVKVKLQGYISGCYGSLTSFNVLFAEVDDQFRGTSGED